MHLLTRLATQVDEPEILRLIGQAEHVHMSADWSSAEDWWAQGGVAVCTRDGRMRGVMAATCEPTPIAWLRAIAVDMDDPSYAIRELLPKIQTIMRLTGAHQIACMAANRWVDRALAACEFEQWSEIESMRKSVMTLPSNASIDVAVRGVVSADFPHLFALDQRAFSDPIWWQSIRHFERAAPEAVSFTAAIVDGTIAGYQLTVQASSRGAHIVRISVDPAMQGRGIGRSLMTHTLRDLDQRGFKKVTLNTQIDNVASHRLYRQFGFQPTGQRFKVWSYPLRTA